MLSGSLQGMQKVSNTYIATCVDVELYPTDRMIGCSP